MFYLRGWSSIAFNQWVLQIVENGYSLPFLSYHPDMPHPTQHLPEDHLSILHREVQALLAKGAMERVPA